MLRQILEVIDRFAPDAVLFGLDDRHASERADFYPGYKAGRPPKDPLLLDQLDRCGALLDALGLATLTPPGLEADDVNASAAAWAGRHGWDCIIVTSDRDSFAHISDHTRVLRLINGGLDVSPVLTPHRLRLMYGVDAAHYLEFAALRGDASDNLPGVSGIGEKGAAALLEAAGPMAAVWADIEHASGRTVAAAVDSVLAEAGGRRSGARIVRQLQADGAGALRVQPEADGRARRPRPGLPTRPPGIARAAATGPRPRLAGGRPPRCRVDPDAGAAGALGAAGVGVGLTRPATRPAFAYRPGSTLATTTSSASRSSRWACSRERWPSRDHSRIAPRTISP